MRIGTLFGIWEKWDLKRWDDRFVVGVNGMSLFVHIIKLLRNIIMEYNNRL